MEMLRILLNNSLKSTSNEKRVSQSICTCASYHSIEIE